MELKHVDFGAFVPYGEKELIVHQQLKQPLFDCEYAAPSAHIPDCSQDSSLGLSGGWWSDARSDAPSYHSTDWCEEPPVMDLSACMRSYTVLAECCEKLKLWVLHRAVLRCE